MYSFDLYSLHKHFIVYNKGRRKAKDGSGDPSKAIGRAATP
jgi:hypothetical protein